MSSSNHLWPGPPLFTSDLDPSKVLALVFVTFSSLLSNRCSYPLSPLSHSGEETAFPLERPPFWIVPTGLHELVIPPAVWVVLDSSSMSVWGGPGGLSCDVPTVDDQY